MQQKTIINNTEVMIQNMNVMQHKRLILQNINIKINQGEFVYVVGKSGAGKSTLLKLLYGELQTKEGIGIVAGIDITRLTWKKIPRFRKRMGIISDEYPLLFHLTVFQNLQFVLKATSDNKKKTYINSRIKEVLDYVSLGDKIYSMPYELSTGEKQRIQIARALLNHAKIIIADEPTANLDPETSVEITSFLHKISAQYNITFIVSTNDYAIIRSFPSRILHIHNNQVNDYASLGDL